MGKYNYSGDSTPEMVKYMENITNELAEANRLKRLEIGCKEYPLFTNKEVLELKKELGDQA